MKRDMDLCREILLFIESDDGSRKWANVIIEGRSKEEVLYHIDQLNQAGLVQTPNGPLIAPFAVLTWNGHEFLDAARKQEFWNKAKTYSLEKTGSLSFEVLKDILKEIGKQAVKGAFT